MSTPNFPSIARQQLSRREFQFFERRPAAPAGKVTPWIGMSLLQKAIRRGHEELALRAAATLLRISPERLWRRCGCIAFEDVGVADLDTVADRGHHHYQRQQQPRLNEL